MNRQEINLLRVMIDLIFTTNEWNKNIVYSLKMDKYKNHCAVTTLMLATKCKM